MGGIFEKKGTTLQRLFSSVVEIFSPFLCEKYIINYYTKLSMRTHEKSKHNSRTFPETSMPWMNFLTGQLSLRNISWREDLFQQKSQVVWVQDWGVCDPNWSSHWLHNPKARKYFWPCYFSGKFRLSPSSTCKTWQSWSGHQSPCHKQPR